MTYGLHKKEDGQAWYLVDVKERLWSTDHRRARRFTCSEVRGLQRIFGGSLVCFFHEKRKRAANEPF